MAKREHRRKPATGLHPEKPRVHVLHDLAHRRDQYARDVSAFLMWAAEPHLEDRKKTGFRVMVFLLLFGALVYMTKRKVWADVAH